MWGYNIIIYPMTTSTFLDWNNHAPFFHKSKEPLSQTPQTEKKLVLGVKNEGMTGPGETHTTWEFPATFQWNFQ